MSQRRPARATVITVVLILVLFLGGAAALFWPQFHQKSQQGLTKQVSAKVIGKQLRPNIGLSARDYALTYTYRVDGHTYRSSANSTDGEISGDPFEVCVDPTRPELNAPRIAGAKCGDAALGKWTVTAERID